MKLLFAIAHFYRYEPSGSKYGSMRRPEPRVRALSDCVSALHGLFGKRQFLVDHAHSRAAPSNQSMSHEVDVVICTTGDHHLLAEMGQIQQLFRHRPSEAEPLLLGYECQAVLRDHLGAYDYYCFLEDDIIVQDPWLFVKLGWFSSLAGQDTLLQPNRFELAPHPLAHKIYCDGHLHPKVTAPFQNVRENPNLTGFIMGTPVRFVRALNPHSGCYFLNAEQFERWTHHPSFLDRSREFIGPLESAASLGIMKTFRVYKSASTHANFFEVKHHGLEYLSLVGRRLRLVDDPSAESLRAPGSLSAIGEPPESEKVSRRE